MWRLYSSLDKMNTCYIFRNTFSRGEAVSPVALKYLDSAIYHIAYVLKKLEYSSHFALEADLQGA
jgi:hypothetical protein